MKKIILTLIAAVLAVPAVMADDEKPEEKKDSAKIEFTDVKLVKSTSVKDQNKSGTCWCFAGTAHFENEIWKAKGDSMEDAGIEEGDIVVVENRQYPEKNEIVVAMDEEGANTLKRYKGTNEKGQATLAFENERKYKGKEIHLDQMRIQGIARFVIKKL